MQNKRGAERLRALVPLLFPFFTFFMAETATGNLRFLTAAGILLSLVLYGLLFLGVFLAFGSTKWSFPILGTVLYVFAAAEYFVISFRERPAMIWDVLALRTAMTVSANYKYRVTPQLAVSAVLLVGAAVLVFRFPAVFPYGRKRRAGFLASWAGVCGGFGVLLFGVLSSALRLEVHMWDPIVSFEKEGVLLSTVLSAKNLIPEKPKGYTKEGAEKLLADLENASVPETSPENAPVPETSPENPPSHLVSEGRVLPENIICIMNESFSDLRLYNELVPGHSFETDGEFLPFFDSLSDDSRTQKGEVYVPVFGAMTANSEYEFLTGNACALTPQGSIPYQFYVKPGEESLAGILKEQGYRAVAMHPYPGYNWNRTRAYENMGFDQFLDGEYYEALGEKLELWSPRGYLSDRSNYDGIIRQITEKKPGEKLFLFNVTMQNHGGYEVEGLSPTVHVTKLLGEDCAGRYPKADQYLTLLQMSDEALRYLLRWCETLDEPTMVVLFGDHQPSVETEFFEALYGNRWSAVPEEEKIASFRTPYLIWSNYEREAEPLGNMSTFMLGNALLKEAGVTPSGFRAQVEMVENQYEAVHSMGTVDRQGKFTSILDLGSLDEDPGIHGLHMLQYYRMFERRQ